MQCQSKKHATSTVIRKDAIAFKQCLEWDDETGARRGRCRTYTGASTRASYDPIWPSTDPLFCYLPKRLPTRIIDLGLVCMSAGRDDDPSLVRARGIYFTGLSKRKGPQMRMPARVNKERESQLRRGGRVAVSPP